MPRVEEVDDLAERFAAARRVTSGQEILDEDHPPAPGQRHIVVLTPGRMLMQQGCPPPGSVSPDMVQSIEAMVPSTPALNVSVIALNEIPALLTDLSESIPFFGYLLGLGYTGHNVTVFEGHPSALAVGCADADLVIVDGGMIPFLQPDWQQVALSYARRLIVFYRDGRLAEFTR